MRYLTFHHILALVMALAVPFQLAEGAGTDATGSAIVTTLGTIHATLDGQSRTWYVVAGQSSDGPYASGVWFEKTGGGHFITLGGLDVEDPPIESFSRGGGDASKMSMGDYSGSSLSMGLAVDLASLPQRISLPENEGMATVIFLPVVDMTDMSGMLVMQSGQVQIEEAAIADGEARVRGTLSGTLTPMLGGESVEIKDGRFDLEGLPNVKDIQPDGP